MGLSAMDDIIDFRMKVSGKKEKKEIQESGAASVATACSDCECRRTQLKEHHEERL